MNYGHPETGPALHAFSLWSPLVHRNVIEVVASVPDGQPATSTGDRDQYSGRIPYHTSGVVPGPWPSYQCPEMITDRLGADNLSTRGQKLRRV